MTVSEETLAGADQALAELGKSDDEISEIRARIANAKSADLQAVDAALNDLAEGASGEVAAATVHTAPTQVPEASAEDWDDEHTEVEILDESDFVLLVDEDELEELEKVGEDDALKTAPPAIPQEGEAGEGDDGFFKKLFGSRRSSNSP